MLLLCALTRSEPEPHPAPPPWSVACEVVDMMDFLTQSVLVPLAALVLSALSVSINERRQRRSREHQRRMRLAGARDDVAFLDAWLKAHDLAAPNADDDPARARAMRDLERAYSVFAKSSGSSLAEDEPATLAQILGSLFLIRRPKGTAARMVRALYYVALAWLLFLAYAWSADVVEGASRKEWFDAGVGFVLFGLVPASLVRAWAVSLDRGEDGPSRVRKNAV